MWINQAYEDKNERLFKVKLLVNGITLRKSWQLCKEITWR